MTDFLTVSVSDDRGITTLSPFDPCQADAEHMQRLGLRNASVCEAVLILQRRIAALEAIPRTPEVASASGKATAGQTPKPIKRLGRADRCRFGYRPDPHSDKRLLPDREEQETVRMAQLYRSYGLSLREVCRKLDQQGHGRRGKKWAGSHSVLRAILTREGRTPVPGQR
jgi:hypothetical protein